MFRFARSLRFVSSPDRTSPPMALLSQHAGSMLLNPHPATLDSTETEEVGASVQEEESSVTNLPERLQYLSPQVDDLVLSSAEGLLEARHKYDPYCLEHP